MNQKKPAPEGAGRVLRGGSDQKIGKIWWLCTRLAQVIILPPWRVVSRPEETKRSRAASMQL